MQGMLTGMEDLEETLQGEQERATRELIEALTEGRELDYSMQFICKTMINIARNFDALSSKGRDTSRVMAQLLSWYQELTQTLEHDNTVSGNPELDTLLEQMHV